MHPAPHRDEAAWQGAAYARSSLRKHLRRRTRLLALAAAATTVLTGLVVASAPTAASAQGALLSQGKPTTASSTENAGSPASNATDGNTGTRWSSAFSDPQWLQVDLGATDTIDTVVLNWEAASGKSFKIQTSTDGSTWTDIYSTTTGAGGIQTLAVTGTGRYVRMYGTVRNTGYGYSLWEFQVFGTAAGGGGGGTCNATTNLALNKAASASSTENAGTPASAAVDGNAGTRWSSAYSDPQWLQVDLGSTQTICQVTLNWEAAYGVVVQDPDVQRRLGVDRRLLHHHRHRRVQNLTVSGIRPLRADVRHGPAHAVRLLALGDGGVRNRDRRWRHRSRAAARSGRTSSCSTRACPAPRSRASWTRCSPPRSRTSSARQRYALLFKPGTYSGLNAQIGFYTSIAGLGQNPDDVQINGDVTVDAGWFGGNATQNFWRSAENMSLTPVSGTDRWAVAQAAPFRRMDIHGGLNLAPNGYGWASGGYIADSRVSGTVGPYSQQQWYTRNSQIGGWVNGVWNMVFSGVAGRAGPGVPEPGLHHAADHPGHSREAVPVPGRVRQLQRVRAVGRAPTRRA